MAKKKEVKHEPDIYEIRQKQSEIALEIARAIDPDAYIGILNDSFFYIVVKEEENAEKIKAELETKQIISEKEYEEIPKEYALYLKDAVVEEKTDDEV